MAVVGDGRPDEKGGVVNGGDGEAGEHHPASLRGGGRSLGSYRLTQDGLNSDRDGQAERQQPENGRCAWSLASPPASWLEYRHERAS